MQTWVAIYQSDEGSEPLLYIFSSAEKALTACHEHHIAMVSETDLEPGHLEGVVEIDEPGTHVAVAIRGDFWDEQPEGYHLYRLNDRSE